MEEEVKELEIVSSTDIPEFGDETALEGAIVEEVEAGEKDE